MFHHSECHNLFTSFYTHDIKLKNVELQLFLYTKNLNLQKK